MTTETRDVFIDTNVLVYATIASAPLHQQAQQSLHQLWISRQVLHEYAMVVTRPQTFMNPLGASGAAAQVDILMRQFQIADDTDRVTAEWSRLLQSIPIGGRQVYDANITATMLAYGVTHLVTNNGRDFARYSHLITVIPL